MTTTITIKGTLPSLNDYTRACRSHWSVGARMKRDAEVVIGLYALRAEPVDGPVDITFDWYEPNRKRDIDNVRFGAKFVLDALVSRGVIAGDNPKTVQSIADRFHLDRENPRVVVTIERTVQ